MTFHEAMEDIQESGINLGAGDYVDIESLKVAVIALKEIQDYKKLGTYEELKRMKDAHYEIASREQELNAVERYCGKGTVKDIEEIECILGYKLTPQQIHYIGMGRWRKVGQTTAYAIRKYLENKGKDIIYKVSTREGQLEAEMQIKIIKKIVSAKRENVKIRIERIR